MSEKGRYGSKGGLRCRLQIRPVRDTFLFIKTNKWHFVIELPQLLARDVMAAFCVNKFSPMTAA